MEFVKFEYCADQIIDLNYNDPFAILSSDSIHYGDVNNDGTLNVSDCAYVARNLAAKTADNLSEAADFNCDGKKDVRDAARMAQFLAGRAAAKQEGFIG